MNAFHSQPPCPRQTLTNQDTLTLAPIDETVLQYVSASKAANTRKAYQSDWQDFEQWCNARGETSLPASPHAVAQYLSELAQGHKPSTLQRRLASISVAHQSAGHDSPTRSPLVRSTTQGIRRTLGMAQRQAAPLLVEHARQAVAILGNSLRETRNKALLLVGMAGAFRRGELMGLDVSDLDFRAQGVVITLRRSKTNQEGHPEAKEIGMGTHEGTCPVRALQQWLEVSGIDAGPVFRPISPTGQVLPERLGDRAVSRIVKAVAGQIGLDPAAFSGHSLRAGFVTTCYRANVSESDIMRQTKHRSRATLATYRREGERFLTNYTTKLGL